jgi:hypothetical protein
MAVIVAHFFPFGLRLGGGGALPVARVARMASSKERGASDTNSVPSVFFFLAPSFGLFCLDTGIFILNRSFLPDILTYQYDLPY